MNTTMNSVRVGLFFALGVALLYIVYTTLGDKALRAESGYEIIATFNDIKTLTPGAEVRMAGVKIGNVGETLLMNGRGQATLKIGWEM